MEANKNVIVEESPDEDVVESSPTSPLSPQLSPSSSSEQLIAVATTTPTSLEIVQNEQKRLNTISDGGSIGMESKKRKAVPSLTINMLQFITLVLDIYREAYIDENSKIVFKKSIDQYLSEFTASSSSSSPSKKIRIDCNDTAVNANIETNWPHYRATTFYNIIFQLFRKLESENAIIQFPKESLKFFLASYHPFVQAYDFDGTNKIIKSDKKNKTLATLTCGSILLEPIRGYDSFGASMHRCDQNDIEALKLIVNNKIELPSKMYHICGKRHFKNVVYETDVTGEKREGYCQIYISNFKRATVLVTNSIVMVYDGKQFIVPPISIEKDFNTQLISNSTLKKNEYMLLDVLMSTKHKVIDIIQTNVEGIENLPDLYSDRLSLVTKTFPKIKTVTVMNSSQDSSFIQKPKKGFGPTYIYHKSNLTAAAIGISETHVILAFRDDSGTTTPSVVNNTTATKNCLVVKTKGIVAGPSIYAITTTPRHLNSHNNKIMFNDIEYTLSGDLSNVEVFEYVIPVELKDNNKIGNISERPISWVSEYKPPSTTKETSTLDALQKQFDNDPSIMSRVMLMIANHKHAIDPETRKLLQSLIEPEIPISFGDYNNSSPSDASSSTLKNLNGDC